MAEADITPGDQDVTDAELAILQSLWDGGASPIGDLADRLYPNGGDSAYATVQKLLERLEKKGHVGRDRSARRHTFAAITQREAIIGRRLRTVAEKLTGGMMAPLLTHLVKAESLSEADRRELRSLIDDLDHRKKTRGDK